MKEKSQKLWILEHFVTVLPGKDGLVHISQICEERVENVTDKVKEGDVVKVKVLEIDKQGRIKLTMKGKLDCFKSRCKDWKSILTKEEFFVCRNKELSQLFLVLSINFIKMELMSANVAGSSFFHQLKNMIRALVLL